MTNCKKTIYKLTKMYYNIQKKSEVAMRKILLSIIFVSIFSISVSAHPGRTDKYGGHVDKSTGLYHYHLDNGTTVQGEKPTESKETTTKPEEITEEKTVIVDNKEKKLQDNVVTETKEEIDTEQKITVKENKDGTRVIYITKQPPLYSILSWLLVLLIILGVIGLAVLSHLICSLIKLTENSKWYNILYIIYTVFWLPSLIGTLIVKLIVKIDPKYTHKSNDLLFYDDDVL